MYLFDTLCQAVRIAIGLDTSEKFLSLIQRFTGVNQLASTGLTGRYQWSGRHLAGGVRQMKNPCKYGRDIRSD